MLQILEGKLAYAPEISKVNTEHGEKECCNMKLHVYAGLNDPAPVIVKINAWEDCARDLANYRKGDIIQFIGETKTFAGIGEEGSSLGDTVKKIDREGSL